MFIRYMLTGHIRFNVHIWDRYASLAFFMTFMAVHLHHTVCSWYWHFNVQCGIVYYSTTVRLVIPVFVPSSNATRSKTPTTHPILLRRFVKCYHQAKNDVYAWLWLTIKYLQDSPKAQAVLDNADVSTTQASHPWISYLISANKMSTDSRVSLCS